MVRHRGEWLAAMGDKATVRMPTYRILVHGVSTKLEVSEITEIEDKI